MKKILITAITIFLLAGCSYRPRVGPPWVQKLFTQGPEGSSIKFQKGWRDGCETGISVTANAFQRHFYRFKQDYELSSDAEYYTGWVSGKTFCFRYVYQYLKRDLV